MRRLKEEKRNVEKMLKEMRSLHKKRVDIIEKKVSTEIKLTQDERAKANKEKDFWVYKVGKMRVVEKELKAENAMIKISLDDALKRLGLAQVHMDKFDAKMVEFNEDVAHGARHLN